MTSHSAPRNFINTCSSPVSACSNAFGKSAVATSHSSSASITAVKNIDSMATVGLAVSSLVHDVHCFLPSHFEVLVVLWIPILYYYSYNLLKCNIYIHFTSNYQFYLLIFLC